MRKQNIPLYSLQDDRTDSEISSSELSDGSRSPSQIDERALSPTYARSADGKIDHNFEDGSEGTDE